MKKKANRLDAIKMIISSKEVGSQEELLQELNREGFELTQATLSRDLKQLKVAKAASMNGKYVYVLPNNIMYKRSTDQSAGEMLRNNGFIFPPYPFPIGRRSTCSLVSVELPNRLMLLHKFHHPCSSNDVLQSVYPRIKRPLHNHTFRK